MLFRSSRGLERYGKLEKITCAEWQDYMLWLRRVLKIPVQSSTRMTLLEPEGKLFKLTVEHEGKTKAMYTRRVVLATGPYSAGGPNIPEQVIKGGIPKSHYAHVTEVFDFDILKGKRVACVGAGASAFDNSGSALDHGAKSVIQLIRRPKIPRLAMIRWTDWSGFLHTFADLPDADKWRLQLQVQKNPSPPPLTALRRVEKYSNFEVHFSSPLLSTKMKGNEIVIETPKGIHTVDFLLLGTGYTFDIANNCPPLAKIGKQIALWRDRYTPPDGSGSERFRNSPYLGRFYEFTEKVPGTAPYLGHIFNFNQSATLSMGPTGRVSGIRYGARRLQMGITGSFIREDVDYHLSTALAFDNSEIEGHPWAEEGRKKKAAE